MASLTTVYFLSLILASFAGMGSGWYGSTMTGGAEPIFNEPSVDETSVDEPSVDEPSVDETTAQEIVPPESGTEQTEPQVSEESLPSPME